jgi:hypothetical protein
MYSSTAGEEVEDPEERDELDGVVEGTDEGRSS